MTTNGSRWPVLAAVTCFVAIATGAPAAVADPVPGAPGECREGPFSGELGRELSARWPGKRFSAAVVDLESGCLWTYRPDLRMTTASVFKIEVLAGVLLRAQAERRSLTTREDELVGPMIRQSADPPTNHLYGELGGSSGFARLNGIFGLGQTEPAPGTWGLTRTSAQDQVALVRQVLIEGGPLSPESRQTAWHYMGSVATEQQWGVGDGLPPGFRFGLKNGFAPSQCCGWRINTAGAVLDRRGGGWVMAVLTDGWHSEAAGREAMSVMARAINSSMLRPALADLVAVRTTGAPRVEAHALAGSTGYSRFSAHRSLRLEPDDESRWSFATGDYDGDRLMDLYVIDHRGSSGTTELHVLSGVSGWQEWSLHTRTALHQTNPDEWTFAISDHDGDRRADLYAVRRSGAATTEVHVIDGASNFERFSSHRATPLEPATSGRWELLVGDVDADGQDDLAAVKRAGVTGTELHVLAGPTFDRFISHAETGLPAAPADRWSFRLSEGRRDGPLDLMAIDGQGERGTEVHVLSGATQWASFSLHAGTALHPTSPPEWRFP